MNILENIVKLPDYMEKEEVKKHFEQVLEIAEFTNEATIKDIAKALWELSERQWHTDTIVDDEIKDRISNWMKSAWNLEDRIIIDLIIGISGMLGLKTGLDLCNNALTQNLDSEFREEIVKDIVRLEKSVKDPYYSLRNLKTK